ncbi:hypothetical protein WJX84_011306 [Apatococcus fuscideae]|uniref:thymidine kinase n=1 Tax=Apatococcus fuscideae TaxID=2026836 RepID=A0AAW1SVJ4_9CHLO
MRARTLVVPLAAYRGERPTELVEARYADIQAASKLCLLLNHKGDVRYAEAGNVVTHDLTQLKAHPVEMLAEAHNRIWQYDVIAVDEGQFMPGEASHPFGQHAEGTGRESP